MPSKIYKANFHFLGNSPKDQNVRQEIIDEFVRARAILVEITNRLISSWNAQYTKDMNLNEYGEDPEYNAYMNSRYRPWLDSVNYVFPAKYIHLDVDEHTDIIGKGINENFTVYLTLEPVN